MQPIPKWLGLQSVQFGWDEQSRITSSDFSEQVRSPFALLAMTALAQIKAPCVSANLARTSFDEVSEPGGEAIEDQAHAPRRL
jgi:hypothetical protein